MCQAYEAEANFIRLGERLAEIGGYKAHKEGLKLSDNPNFPGYYHEAWAHGWGCRQERFVPYVLKKRFRDKKEKETGQPCFDNPSFEEADALC